MQSNLIAQTIDIPAIVETAFPSLKDPFKPSRTPSSSQIAQIVSLLLPYIFVVAGLLLLFNLISGGFSFMTAGDSPDGSKKAKLKITNALIGFIILFVAYWIMQIIEVMLGVDFGF